MVVAVPAGLAGLPPALDKPVRPGVNAWVCRGVNCLAPIAELAGLARELQAA
jgi:hypothetical protein